MDQQMTAQRAISICLSAHYYLMRNSRFWYDKALIDASKILCVAASDLRIETKRLELLNCA